ncbi:MAG: MaoC family dehydratase [Proteobacteria bacterium]|nr:MaoC family dehydratase [Pseudomonadota bacterium]
MATRESFGRYFEDFAPGEVIEHWPGRTVTETDNLYFSLLTMNQHPLHIDAAYAEDTQFGQRLVVGPLVFSVVVGMTVADISGKAIANLAYESVVHDGPTFHGDTLYARTTVLDKRASRSRPDRGVVQVETQGLNQRGEVVLTFRRSVLVPRRTAGEGA